MKMRVEGVAELRRELLQMASEASTGGKSGMLIPLVSGGADIIQAAAQTLAPKRSGRGAASITVQLIKHGAGYAYCLIAPEADFYYMMFQEFGLGSGRSIGESERTRRRRESYERSIALRQQIVKKVGAGNTFAAALGGLGKREARRQKALAAGKYVQGQRRPNMAAQPFMRPAVTWRWPYVRQYINDGLLRLIRRHEKAA